MPIVISLFFCQLALLAENHASWQIAGILVVDGGSGRCHHGCCHHTAILDNSPLRSALFRRPVAMLSPHSVHLIAMSSCQRVSAASSPCHRHLLVSSSSCRRHLVVSPPLSSPQALCTDEKLYFTGFPDLANKIQQMTLEQSFQESFQVFLLKAHRHNFGECVGGGNVVSICIIIMTLLSISLQTHPAKPASS